MAYSYNFKHTAELKREDTKPASGTGLAKPSLSKSKLGMMVGGVFLGLLLLWSWSLDGLFFSELIAVTCIWGLVSLVKLKSEPKYTQHEKR